MERLVEAIVEDPRWEEVDLPGLAERAARATLTRLGLDPDARDISLLACDDTRIAALNQAFRGRSGATNVLSWPSEDRAPDAPGATPPRPAPDEPELGDIAISWDSCRREAAAAALPLEAHVTHLLVHGTLHLLGYDHGTEEDAALMERLEVEILASLGVPDPYRNGAPGA